MIINKLTDKKVFFFFQTFTHTFAIFNFIFSYFKMGKELPQKDKPSASSTPVKKKYQPGGTLKRRLSQDDNNNAKSGGKQIFKTPITPQGPKETRGDVKKLKKREDPQSQQPKRRPAPRAGVLDASGNVAPKAGFLKSMENAQPESLKVTKNVYKSSRIPNKRILVQGSQVQPAQREIMERPQKSVRKDSVDKPPRSVKKAREEPPGTVQKVGKPSGSVHKLWEEPNKRPVNEYTAEQIQTVSFFI